MFAYIQGNLDTKTNTFVIIDVQGIGYRIFMSSRAIESLGEIGDTVKVYTHYYVREDNISLYGFNSQEELRMFELLISVSGIGAKSAIAMLSQISSYDFALAVISNDVSKLVKVPGIGKKTAARIILELKDKLKTEETIEKDEQLNVVIEDDNKNSEAVAALQVLGYSKKEIEKVFEKIDKKDLAIEEIIKQALKYLGRS